MASRLQTICALFTAFAIVALPSAVKADDPSPVNFQWVLVYNSIPWKSRTDWFFFFFPPTPLHLPFIFLTLSHYYFIAIRLYPSFQRNMGRYIFYGICPCWSYKPGVWVIKWNKMRGSKKIACWSLFSFSVSVFTLTGQTFRVFTSSFPLLLIIIIFLKYSLGVHTQ